MAQIPLTRTGPDDGGNFEYHWSDGRLEAHLLSDVGKKRARNEDSCILCAPEDNQLLVTHGLLFSVADGMGGASGGAYASKLALQTLVEEYFGIPNGSVPERLKQAVEKANRRIFEVAEGNPDFFGMGTTVSTLLIKGGCAYIAQVGDSRIYLTRGNAGIWQLTDDHSLVAEQLRGGYISEQEARNHALKNLITRAVGTKEEVTVDLFSLRLKQGDTLLICSDGLSNLVEETSIASALAMENLQGAARKLVGEALAGGAPDNITVVLVRVTGELPQGDLEEGGVKVHLAPRGLWGRIKQLFS